MVTGKGPQLGLTIMRLDVERYLKGSGTKAIIVTDLHTDCGLGVTSESVGWRVVIGAVRESDRQLTVPMFAMLDGDQADAVAKYFTARRFGPPANDGAPTPRESGPNGPLVQGVLLAAALALPVLARFALRRARPSTSSG